MPLVPNMLPGRSPGSNPLEATVRALEARVAALESALQVGVNQVVLQTGAAKITLTPAGDVTIVGTGIRLSSAGSVRILAGGDLIMKGAKITQN